MATPGTAADENLEIALELSRAARMDPKSPLAGKQICVSRGQVVAVADTVQELESRLEALNIAPEEAVCIEVNADYEGIHMIWSASGCRG